ncbi:retrovirus-related pol polyprotein from transposon TNT 1-94 [Tanacetum coccineum]|uniref:Retrovirus-related pol polyprotein from transposon TNT 1-94 n=1 Tax=Tanacetum coccineum TaxID=301880 RepID=A0ABQ4XSF7_9ASTR
MMTKKNPSPTLQLSSPSSPNAPSKTPSTKDTSSSLINYIPKSPTSSTSLSPNGYLNPPTSPPPRVSPPPPTQENALIDITLTLSPITPLDVQFDTPSPSPPILGYLIPWNLLEAHGDSLSTPSSSNIDLNIIDLQKENEELLKFNKDFTKTFEKLLNEKLSLESRNSKLVSKINVLELEVKKLVNNKEVCLKCDLLLDDWIVDSGCTKHMNGNRRLFTSYKAYDGGHVVFGSNLKGKVIGGGPFTSQSSEIVERTHRKLRKMSHAMLEEQSIPQKFWCHELDTATYMFNRVYVRKFINKTPYEILRNRKPSLEYFRVFGCKVFILNTKETMRIRESLNVTFNESLPELKSFPLVEDDRINKPIVQDLNGSPSLQVNVSDEGYPRSLKEASGYLIGQVIGELNERTLRAFLKLCIVEDPIWEKISCELEEPIRNAHVNECICCQVKQMTEQNMYALHKEMREIHTFINNDLKVLTAVIKDIAMVLLQDINE